MVIEVYNSKPEISTSDNLMARTSQCVAVGLVSSAYNLAGLVQVHFTSDHERVLNSLIEGCMAIDNCQENYIMGIGGGVDAFIPGGYGFIPGSHNADRVLNYLAKIGFENAIKKGVVDIHEDYIRILIAYISKRAIEIKRLKQK